MDTLGYLLEYLFVYKFFCEHAFISLGYGVELLGDMITMINLFFFLRFYLFIFRGEGTGKERERNINVWLPLVCPPLGDLACHLGVCLAWESRERPLASQACAQSTEPHQPGPIINLLRKCQTVFQSSCAILLSHQRSAGIPLPLHP